MMKGVNRRVLFSVSKNRKVFGSNFDGGRRRGMARRRMCVRARLCAVDFASFADYRSKFWRDLATRQEVVDRLTEGTEHVENLCVWSGMLEIGSRG